MKRSLTTIYNSLHHIKHVQKHTWKPSLLETHNVLEPPEKTKDPSLAFYKWGYKPLPTQTVLDEENPQFRVRPAEFKLPNRYGRLSRRMWRQRMAQLQNSRNSPHLEKLSRNRKLYVDLDQTELEWKKEYGLFDLHKLARFYGITQDAFNGDDIVVKTWLDIAFNDEKIHRGNVVQPAQLLSPPDNISYNGDDDKLYSLILTNLDGHPLESDKELVHWMVGNISGNGVANGDTLVDYLPPVPWKGTGSHRLLFVLYEQERKITYGSNKKSIVDRTFSLREFASSNQLLPVGISWCQLAWDESVTDTCQSILELFLNHFINGDAFLKKRKKKDEEHLTSNQLTLYSNTRSQSVDLNQAIKMGKRSGKSRSHAARVGKQGKHVMTIAGSSKEQYLGLVAVTVPEVDGDNNKCDTESEGGIPMVQHKEVVAEYEKRLEEKEENIRGTAALYADSKLNLMNLQRAKERLRKDYSNDLIEFAIQFRLFETANEALQKELEQVKKENSEMSKQVEEGLTKNKELQQKFDDMSSKISK